MSLLADCCILNIANFLATATAVVADCCCHHCQFIVDFSISL